MKESLPQRKSPRLPEYDYSQPGAYFITFCSQDRASIFGSIVDSQFIANRRGEILSQCWLDLPQHYPDIILDEFIVMPNHFHGIVFVAGPSDLLSGGSETRPYKPVSVTEIVRALKGFSSRRMNEAGLAQGGTIWQRGFYDHVIRSDSTLKAIREYIVSNPLGWEQDELNPHRNPE